MNSMQNQDVEANTPNFDRCAGFEHVIKKGDTLYKLSKQYNVKVSALILANPYVNIYNLQVGDTICIPRLRPIVVPVVPGRPQEPEMRPPVRPNRPQEPMPPVRPDRPQEPEMRPPVRPVLPSGSDRPASPEEGILPTPEVRWEVEMQEDNRMQMPVNRLLEEWDISYSMLEDVMDIIKKLRRLL